MIIPNCSFFFKRLVCKSLTVSDMRWLVMAACCTWRVCPLQLRHHCGGLVSSPHDHRPCSVLLHVPVFTIFLLKFGLTPPPPPPENITQLIPLCTSLRSLCELYWPTASPLYRSARACEAGVNLPVYCITIRPMTSPVTAWVYTANLTRMFWWLACCGFGPGSSLATPLLNCSFWKRVGN